MISSLMTNPTFLLLTALLLVSVKTQTVLLPDCPNGIINPSCPTGGIVINAGSVSKQESLLKAIRKINTDPLIFFVRPILEKEQLPAGHSLHPHR